MDTETGRIRELKGDAAPRAKEIEITADEAHSLRRVRAIDRMARLVGLREHNNGRRRKAAKAEAKAKILTERKTPRERCPARDKNGHRCHHKPHPRGNHSAFGKEWK